MQVRTKMLISELPKPTRQQIVDDLITYCERVGLDANDAMEFISCAMQGYLEDLDEVICIKKYLCPELEELLQLYFLFSFI